MKIETTLYGKAKRGTYKLWHIAVTEGFNEATLTITHGQEGGQMQSKSENFQKGKQGRTASEQALLEANARIKKQLDKHYRHTKADLEALPVLAVLAKDHNKDGKESIVEDGVFTSVKYDGVRCLAKCLSAGVVSIESRTGQPWNVPHISEELAKIMEPGDILDGEIYYHGAVLQDILSAVKRHDAQEKAEKAAKKLAKAKTTDYEKLNQAFKDAVEIQLIRENLKFYVFDVVQSENVGMEDPFYLRLTELNNYSDRFLLDGCVVATPYGYVESMEELLSAHKAAVAEGYEGIMYRTRDGVYESGKRSAFIWKYKEFIDDEFLILDILPAKDDGCVYLLKNNLTDGTFTCTLGDMNDRAAALLALDRIGKYMTAQFQSRYKKTLLPQFPTGKAIREGFVTSGGIFIPTE